MSRFTPYQKRRGNPRLLTVAKKQLKIWGYRILDKRDPSVPLLVALKSHLPQVFKNSIHDFLFSVNTLF
jgi:hypothetical protein